MTMHTYDYAHLRDISSFIQDISQSVYLFRTIDTNYFCAFVAFLVVFSRQKGITCTCITYLMLYGKALSKIQTSSAILGLHSNNDKEGNKT